MKAGYSTLNPFAESYIPLSKRGTPDENNDFKSSGNESKRSNEAVKVGAHHWDLTAQAPRSYNMYTYENFYSSENSKLKGHATHGYPCSSSYNPAGITENQIRDEEREMDLAYLQMTFPGISDESLLDVYLANKGDLDATVDMLNHLEFCSVDSSEKLPDTLDIGDVPESGGAGEFASQKQKNLNFGAGASTSAVSRMSPAGK